MTVSSPAPAPSATAARRASGAMFFAVFGTAWSWWGEVLLRGARDWTLAPLLATGLGIAIAARRRFVANRGALAEQADSPRTRRISRVFHAVNAAQWVLVVVLANVLNARGLGAWIAPMVMTIVGLHFLPLAAVMGYRPHYLSGAALVSLAIVFPFVSAAGPRSGIGPLGAGLVLWASAIFGLTTGSSPAKTP